MSRGCRFVVEEKKLTYPTDVGFFGAVAIVFDKQHFSDFRPATCVFACNLSFFLVDCDKSVT